MEEIRAQLNKLRTNDRLPQDVIEGINLLDANRLITELSKTNIKFFQDLLSDRLPDLTAMFRAQQIEYEENECCVCNERPCASVHVLASCRDKSSLKRFYRRHDDVLEIIFTATEEVLLQPEWDVQMSTRPHNNFLPGDVYPHHDLVPNMFALSRKQNLIYLVMVTVPWIHSMENEHRFKTQKYLEMVSHIEKQGYRVEFHALEISYGGMPSRRLLDYFLEIGLSEERAMEYVYSACRRAITSSQEVWNSWARQEARVHPDIAQHVLRYDEPN